jgi:iron(III) transport system ATP-binding protein
VECELARLPADPGFQGAADVLVRPESVSLSTGPAGSGRGRVEGRVVEREFFGHDQLVHVELPSGRRIRSRSLSFPVWHPGDRVRVSVDGPVNVFKPEDSAHLRAIAMGDADYDFDALAEIHAQRGEHLDR